MSCKLHHNWTTVSRGDATSAGECASKTVRWCYGCGTVEVIHDGEYSWNRAIYKVGERQATTLAKSIQEVLGAPMGSCVCLPEGDGAHKPDCKFR